MEFKVGDRVDVVTYPEAQRLYSGTVVAIHDESAYHEMGFCECAYTIRPDGAVLGYLDGFRVLAAYVVARRNCEACGTEILEPATCHVKDHRDNVCAKCDSGFGHVWPKGYYAG